MRLNLEIYVEKERIKFIEEKIYIHLPQMKDGNRIYIKFEEDITDDCLVIQCKGEDQFIFDTSDISYSPLTMSEVKRLIELYFTVLENLIQ